MYVASNGEEGAAYAHLVDTVRAKKGMPQLYGTKTDYDPATGKIAPLVLESPEFVDQRRQLIGLRPLWQHLNEVGKLQRSISLHDGSRRSSMPEPAPYPEGFVEWKSFTK